MIKIINIIGLWILGIIVISAIVLGIFFNWAIKQSEKEFNKYDSYHMNLSQVQYLQKH